MFFLPIEYEINFAMRTKEPTAHLTTSKSTLQVRTETQVGKGAVDHHFAVDYNHVDKHIMVNAKVNTIVRINTSRGLAYALQ